MKKLILLTCLVLLCAFSTNLFAAKDKEFKFGKISPEELNASVCPIDSNAHAYYIFDIGDANFNYMNGFQIIYRRHFRIKILDKSGFNNATITIPYYETGSTKERVYNLKAFTYNMEGGKMVKTELDKKDIFDEETTKFWKQKKFALPNVKEGSVIEVSYTVSSERYWYLQGKQFQYEIPVLYSKYEVEIPEYYSFSQSHRGYVMAKTTQDSGSGVINFNNGQNLNYTTTIFNYLIENVPAFPIGEELTTPDNYLARVEYELASIQIPGSVYKNYTTSWEDVNTTFLDDDDFGGRLKTTGFLKNIADSIKTSAKTDEDKMKAAFEFMKKKLKWNETSSCWTSATLKKTFDTGIGNAADINLNLVALLKEIGLYASPVVLSTRSNGMIHPSNASINQMNYVVAACRLNGVVHLMDATDKYADVDILPSRCLNDKGWIVDKTLFGWEQLLKDKKSKESTLYNLSLSPEGTLTGNIDVSYQELKALSKRNQIKDYESEEKYIEKVQESNSGLKINKFEFTNLDTTGVDLKSRYEVEITDKVEVAGDLLFFAPMLYDAYEKNPFSLEKREYPVEYASPITENVVVNLTVPDGFAIESLPASFKIAALGNNCQFSYKTGQQDNRITIMSTLQINQTIIPGIQYAEFKRFFEEVVKKHLEKVVLKKV